MRYSETACLSPIRSLNQLKMAARYLVHKAIKEGRLKREPCDTCGSNVRIHAHHDDYAKPLEIRWLCQKCHGIVTRIQNMKIIASGGSLRSEVGPPRGRPITSKTKRQRKPETREGVK